MMTLEQAHTLCEQGQRELVRTNYLEAERLLALAEAVAWELSDYDLLARVYMPLQESRRQKRQRCGEGTVRLDLIAGEADVPGIVERHPCGQLLVAGRGSIEPALQVRRLARERHLYLETFLAAAYETGEGMVVAVIPEGRCAPPETRPWVSSNDLSASLPFGAFVVAASGLPSGPAKGTSITHALVMGLWERLHAPFLKAADAHRETVAKLAGYRRTIEVDAACELAHQKISAVARRMGLDANSPAAG